MIESLFLLGFTIFIPLMLLLLIGGFVLWIFMLIDCAQRKFKKENDKVVWILVLALAGVIGAIIYYFAVKHKSKK